MIKETKTKVHFHINNLNLGNNFTHTHLVEAIKENETAMNDVEKLYHIDLSKDLILTANIKYNHILKDTFYLCDFLVSFEINI